MPALHGGMGVESIRGVVEAAIQRASTATGVDFGFLLGAARRESNYNPGARSQKSSAAGLFQFVDQTWMVMLKKHGAKYGYARYAELIQQGSDGRYYVPDADARRMVMDLKLDPHAASLMAGELASDHASYLRGRMGRDPTAGELYVAHFLGPEGSAKLIEAARTSPNAPAAALLPDAAGSNHKLFYNDGRALTAGELYASLTHEPSSGVGPIHIAPEAPRQPDFTQYASARRLDRIAQEQALVDLVLRGPEQPDQAGGGGGLTGSLFSAEMLRTLTATKAAGG